MSKRPLRHYYDADYIVAIQVFLANYALTVFDTPFKLNSDVIVICCLVCKDINRRYQKEVAPYLDKIVAVLEMNSCPLNLGYIDIYHILRLFRANKQLVISIVKKGFLSEVKPVNQLPMCLENANIYNPVDKVAINVMSVTDSRLFFEHYLSYCPLPTHNCTYEKTTQSIFNHLVTIRIEQDKYADLCEQIVDLTEEDNYLEDRTQEQRELRFSVISECLNECTIALYSIRATTHLLTIDLCVIAAELGETTTSLYQVIQNAVMSYFNINYLLGYIGHILQYMPIENIMAGREVLFRLVPSYSHKTVIHDGLAHSIARYYRRNLMTLGTDITKFIMAFRIFIGNNQKNTPYHLLPLSVFFQLVFRELQWIPDKIIPLLNECQNDIGLTLDIDKVEYRLRPYLCQPLVDSFISHIHFCITRKRYTDIIELLDNPILRTIVPDSLRVYLNDQLIASLLEIVKKDTGHCDLLTAFSILLYLDREGAKQYHSHKETTYFKESSIRNILDTKTPKEVILFIQRMRMHTTVRNQWNMYYFTSSLINEYIATMIHTTPMKSKRHHLRHFHQIMNLFTLNSCKNGELVFLNNTKTIEPTIEVYFETINDDDDKNYCLHCKMPILKCIQRAIKFVSSIHELSSKYKKLLEMRWISILNRLIIKVITEIDTKESLRKEEKECTLRLIESHEYEDDTNELINYTDDEIEEIGSNCEISRFGDDDDDLLY